ncbi:MAG: CDP-alcohol phosphatidyltransferase family protein [bacterium]
MKITSSKGRKISSFILSPLVRLFCYIKIPPNVITFMGLIVSLSSIYFISVGKFIIGGLLILFGGAFDLVDGEVSRRRVITSKFGAFFDSFIDRYSDNLVYIGFIYYFALKGEMIYIILCGLILIGSMMVSYARARAEGLGLECKVGFFERTERLLVLVIGALFGGIVLRVSLWIIAVGSHMTALQRLIYVHIKSKQENLRIK